MNWIIDVLITSVGFGLFALLHSILANRKIKKKIFTTWPAIEPVYRIGYTFFSILTLGAWYLFSPFPGGMLYEVPYPFSMLSRIVQLAGLTGFFYSLKSINLGKFIGLSQLLGTDDPQKTDELVTRGLYRWVRHPLYTATMMILLFNPVMSNKLALINLLFGCYCWIGSIYEERNLVSKFGESYEQYRKQVPRFIPKFPLF